MTNTASKYLIDDLEKLIHEMQYLVDHPRIQQKTWVANGRKWLPILHRIKGEITTARDTSQPQPAEPVPQKPKTPIVLEVHWKGQTFMTFDLEEVAQVTIDRSGEPGYRAERGVVTQFRLKDGRSFSLSKKEALRLLDELKKLESR